MKHIKMTLLAAISATSMFATAETATESKYDTSLVPVEQAVNHGIKTCMDAVSKMSEFVIEDGQHGAHGVWSKEEDGQYSAIIERVYSDGSTITNISAVPSPDGTCAAQYVKTINFDENCMSTLKMFDNAEIQGTLAENVTYLKDGDVNMYMLPIGARNEYCQVVRKEVLTF
jgi:hypothetical protein